MCSVSGFYSPASSVTEKVVQYRAGVLAELLAAGTERGRDSWGVASLSGEVRGLGAYDGTNLSGLVDGRWVVAVNRAEPSTERVGGDVALLPPFRGYGWTVTHNGVIANDGEWRDGFVSSPVDSAVLPTVLAACNRLDAESVRNYLESSLVGSWAILAGLDGKLVASVSFRPLYMRWDEVGECWWLTSSPVDRFGALRSRLSAGWQPLEPYSTIVFSGDGWEEATRPAPEQRKVLAVCSGGLDSVTAASVAAAEGAEVTLMHAAYGARAQDMEAAAVQAISERMGWPVLSVNLTAIYRSLSSSLLDLSRSLTSSVESAEYAHEWVPARNLVLLAVATALADDSQFSEIVLGANMEEAGAYPDNEQEFIHRLNTVLPFAVSTASSVQITMPVGHLMKAEIVQLGVEVGAPLDLTWSCYEAGPVPCGDCGPCYLRREGFAEAGVVDLSLKENQ